MTSWIQTAPLGLIATAALVVGAPLRARAVERVVGPGEAYTTIQAGIDAAVDGDVVTVRTGTYSESLATRAPGVTLRADPTGGEVVVASDAGVLVVRHARVTVEGLVLDGNYGAHDAVVVDDAGTGFTLRSSTVRRSGRDCIDLRNVSDVTIERSVVHHCLWSSMPGCAADACRQDAHGIVGGVVRNLVIRDTEIHTFSGDAFQADPGRGAPGWNDVTIDRCHIWLAPLAAAEGGFAAGVVPGENAVDTKTPPSVAEPARITIRDSVLSGFGMGLLGNQAALNLKENVDALVERVTVSGSEIAFRLRGATASSPRGAHVTLRNVVVYDVAVAVRYEDDITPVTLENVTLGNGVTTAFARVSAPAGRIAAQNVLVLGAAVPSDATGASNLAVGDTAFVGAAANDYHLAPGSAAIDVGEALATVTVDRDGTARPQGAAWDVGAYEACSGATCGPGADAGAALLDAGGLPGGDGGVVRVDAGGGGGVDGSSPPADGGPAGAADAGGCGCRVIGARGHAATSILAALMALCIVLARSRARRVTRVRRRAARAPRMTLVLFAVFTGFASRAAAQTTIAVDLGATHQTMEGFGATTSSLAYGPTDNVPAAARALALAALYRDVRLNMGNLAVEPCESPSTDLYAPANDDGDPFSASPAGFNWLQSENMHDKVVAPAAAYGFTDFYLGPVVGTGYALAFVRAFHDTDYDRYLDEIAEHVLAVVTHWRDAYGISPRYLAPFNEPTSGNGEVLGADGAELVDIVRRVGARLRAAGFATLLVVPSEEREDISLANARLILDDPEAGGYVGAIGYHPYPYGSTYAAVPNILATSGAGMPDASKVAIRNQLRDLAAAHGVQVFMTEVSHSELAFDDFRNVRGRAIHIHDELVYADASAFFGMNAMWDTVSHSQHFMGRPDPGFWNETDTIVLIDDAAGTVTISPMGRAIGHYARFITRGAVRVDATSSDPLVLATAFRDPGTGRAVVVLVNDATAARDLVIPVTGALLAGAVEGELSTAAAPWAPVTGATVDVATGTLRFTMPPESVLTLSATLGGATPDGGADVDAGSPVVDPDGGVVVGMDAGPGGGRVDAGAGGPAASADSGCGCRTAGARTVPPTPGALLALAFALLVTLRAGRRRRRAPRVCFGVALWLAAACSGCGDDDGAVTDGGGSRDAGVADAARPDAAGLDAARDDGAIAAGDPLDPSLAPAVDMDPSHYPASVWVTDGMVKAHPDATPGVEHWALLHAARNELESFQVHVKATAAPVTLTVTVSDLVDARSGTTIPANADVTVYREAYLDITTLSDANGTLGRTPDPLVPAVDPYVHEARNAFPVTVPAGETRSAWIDVLVPADAPSGYYMGSVTVQDGATTLATLPIRLAVWDFAIPATATLRSGFGLGWNSLCVQQYGDYAACAAYPGATSADDAVERIHVAQATMFLDYRVSLGDVVYAPVTGSDFAHFDAVYGPLFDGTAGTRLPGAKLTGNWYTGDRSDATQLSRWRDHFAAMPSWTALTAVYYCDEPPAGCSWAEALSRAETIHAGAPGLPTLLTTDYSRASMHGLLDAVDVLVSIIEHMEPRGGPSARGDYDAWLAMPGKHLWWYQSCDEHESCSNGTPGGASSTWPSYMVDATPARNRVFQWLAYLDRIEGELYYASDYCFTAGDCGDATSGTTRDPWTSIYAFGGNGDGTLYYPGTTSKIGGTTPIPVPSVRLALIRDGMEDYEYLHALDVAGDGAFATSTARAFITDATTFDNDPSAMQTARLALGDRLHRRVHP